MPQNPTPATAGVTNPTAEQLVIELLTTTQSMKHGVTDAHRLLRQLRKEWRAEDGAMLDTLRPSRTKVLTEAAEFLADAGETNAAYLLRTVDVLPAEKVSPSTPLRHADVAAMLMAKPNEWCLIKIMGKEQAGRALAGFIRRAMTPAYAPSRSFEAEYRNVNGEHQVYARFVGAKGGAA